jgi:hypothetical protein
MNHVQIVPKIRQLDKTLQHHCGGTIASLNPQKSTATTYEELFETIDLSTIDNVTSVLSMFFSMQQEECQHFPNNIFWDKDYFVGYIFNEVSSFPASLQQEFLDSYTSRFVSLLQLFGNQSIIRFQYLHDFSYGFDWAKWVYNDSEARSGILPFSMQFLDRMFSRGKELEVLISENNSKYPQIPTENYRNPFQFHRNVECETILLRTLVTLEAIPIQSWEINGNVEWNKPFNDIRSAEAERLGF